MIDVFRFDSARRSCQAPRSRSCDGASPVVSKNTNELKTSSPGRFGIDVSTLGWPMGARILCHEHAGPGVVSKNTNDSGLLVTLDPTRDGDDQQGSGLDAQGKRHPATGCHAPGRKPGFRPGPHLDQNVLGQLRRGNLSFDSEPLGRPLFRCPQGLRSEPAPLFSANVAVASIYSSDLTPTLK